MKGWRSFFFFFPPLYTMTRLLQDALSLFSLRILQLRRGYFQILLAQSSAQKIRNGGEFQQRGQKNSANSLQMCLWAVWGEHCAALAREKKDSALEKVQWIMSKKHQWPSTAGSDWLSGFPGKRKQHILSLSSGSVGMQNHTSVS